MSTEIQNWMVDGFRDNVEMLSQQKGTKLMPFVRQETQNSKTEFFEQLAPTEMLDVTTRHADTPLVEQDHQRRAVTLITKNWADLVDKKDKVQTLVSPTGAYTNNAAMALNRAYDAKIMEAALGNALTGVDGTTVVALPAGNKIATGATFLTKVKLISAQEIFESGDVDPDSPKYIAVTQRSLNALLQDTTATSSDYVTVKALVEGSIDSWMGFKFIRVSPSLFQRSGTDYLLPAWAENGLLFSKGEGGMVARISERDDKNYSTQVYLEDTFGATRMEEAKVVQIGSQV